MVARVATTDEVPADITALENQILVAAGKVADANRTIASMVGIGIVMVDADGRWYSRVVVPEGMCAAVKDRDTNVYRKPNPGELTVHVARHFKLFVDDALAKGSS